MSRDLARQATEDEASALYESTGESMPQSEVDALARALEAL